MLIIASIPIFYLIFPLGIAPLLFTATILIIGTTITLYLWIEKKELSSRLIISLKEKATIPEDLKKKLEKLIKELKVSE